jgi:AcrR family transcriptional regulator
MVAAAAALLASHGAGATSFADIIAASGAPRGSIYHHFPQGRTQLILEAVEATGQWLQDHQRACQATTAAGVLDCFVDIWRQVVLASSATSGCAVAGTALDSAADQEAGAQALTAARAVFEAWIYLLSTQLQDAGVAAPRARALATTVLAALEGSLILCRAQGSVEPLETVARELFRLLPDDS